MTPRPSPWPNIRFDKFDNMGPLKSVCILSVECVLQVIPMKFQSDAQISTSSGVDTSESNRALERDSPSGSKGALIATAVPLTAAYRRREVRPGKMVRIFSPYRGDPDVVRATVAFAPPLMPRRTAIPSFRPLGLYGLIPTTRAPESAADAVPLPSRHR